MNRDFNTILESKPSPEETVMLDHFSGVDSLITIAEALTLYRLCMILPQQKRVLEIGSYRGGSTVAIGHAAKQNNLEVFCIDIWSEYQKQFDFINFEKSHLDDMRIMSEFIRNTSFITDRLHMLRGDAAKFCDVLADNLFSLVFIDGAHDYDSVSEDLVTALKLIEPGGIICGHDYHSGGVSVKKAVHDILMSSEKVTIKGVVESTSIWYAVIDDPVYEYLLAKTVRHMACGDFVKAYEILANGCKTVKVTDEAERILQGLKCRLGLPHSNSFPSGNSG